MTNFLQERTNMIDGQIHTAGVVNEAILNAFQTTPRELFLPEKLKAVAYTDENLDIGQGRYLMEPIVHSKMLQAIEPTSSDVVLDIGCGSGYSSAILSSIVSTVIAVENNKRQIDKANRAWESLDCCNIALIDNKLNEGEPEHAPYSMIVINGAVTEVPSAILDQLDINGRLVTVVTKAGQKNGQAMLFVKNQNGSVSSKALFDASIPFLKEFYHEAAFQL